ncbi:hypothetical protein Tco_1396827 [Tanacetum coccineum]
MTMEILLEPTSNKLCVTNRFTLIVLSALRRPGKENKQVGPHGTEGIGHKLFNVGQFCDGDLEVAFRFKTCYVRNLEGDDLLTGARESNLYTISILDMASSLLVCLMTKATSTKS